ncbi:hypothetical protein JX265_000209 [Neoarthrinium moseri]|uniref:Uncharacterized protein n=1 Tax=Neoarthrinium moseri TaxID=1658444 RepID=A0A9Q0AS16_9PEZI|nr:uncharacterized protein JN550_001091 [Neoarthrinium moseri]KAI1877019.1 hypothetical protein JN550_001091 [Neoarthrinium moseri]KAI1881383.1 hypothetical protein JX265_000209 [Neoarthrinium moseri]
MEDQESVLADKARRAQGEVYRPPGASATGNPPLADEYGEDGTVSPPPESQQTKLPPYSSPHTSYVDPRSRTVVPKGPQYYPGLPILDYRQYSPPMFELSADTNSITSKATYLSENVMALSTLIKNLATVPPKPQILVVGNRGRKVDFSIKLNLLSLLVPDDARNRLDYLRIINKDEMGYRGGQQPALKPEVENGGLEEWCKRFVDDPANVKTFTMERVVANMDTNWLEGQIRSLVAAVQYKGLVTVSFPVTHSRVTIQNPDKVNKFFTSVSALFTGKSKYEVVKAVWPFATAQNGEPNRQCLVQSEKTWWEEWKDPIRYAIATKRHGWVTNEDKLECIMESKGKGLDIVDWGPDY